MPDVAAPTNAPPATANEAVLPADTPQEPGEPGDLFAGFDLGGTKMLAYAFDAKFERLGRERKKTHGQRGQKAGLDRICEVIHGALEDADRKAKDLSAIGIGCPGPIDMDTGVLLDPPNLGWGKTAIGKHLEREFGCPVHVLNDVDAGVYGEYRFGAGQGSRCVIGVFPGTGVGGGCVYNGEVLRGAGSSVMEIGHIQVDPEGPLCGCGHRGCLEAVGSRLAVSAAAAKAAYRGEAPHLFESAGTDLREIRSGAIRDAIKEGDTVIEDIVRDASKQLGIGVAGLIHILGPDTVILGGGLAEALPKTMTRVVEEAARSRVMPAYRKSFKVRPAELGDDAGCLGAAAWAQKQWEAAQA